MMLNDQFKSTAPTAGFEHNTCKLCKRLYEREINSAEELCRDCRKQIVDAASTMQPNQHVKLTMPKIEATDELVEAVQYYRCPYCREEVLLNEKPETLAAHWNSGCGAKIRQTEAMATEEPFNLHNNMWDIIALVNISKGQKYQDAFLNADAYIKARDEYLRSKTDDKK